MLDVSADPRRSARPPAGPPLDFQAHLAALEAQGLVVGIDRAINKDTELHPLVRWQFQGGLAEDQRRAFLFTYVTDSSGRRYDIPVAVGALAASPRVYAVGMGRPVQEIEAAWVHAIAHPIAPIAVSSPPCQAVVIKGDDLRGAMTNGMTPNEIRAVLTQISVYCGIPVGVDCFRIAKPIVEAAQKK